MKIKNYDEMNLLEMDVIQEIGSIGTGNAATALSSVLDQEVKMTIPAVHVLGYNEALHQLGEPEEIVAAVLKKMSGEINGIMLFILKLDFINVVLERLLGRVIDDFSELMVIELSAMEEIGNIVISSYITALSSLTGVEIQLSVPDIAVNMLGGILSVPMVEFGYETDKLLIINGKFIVGGKVLNSDILMLPDIPSLNGLMEKLGVTNG